MKSALEAAKWFYNNNGQVKTDSKRGNVVVQKLCYYAQAMSLVVLNRPMFANKISAWKQGPVIANVYYNYRWYTPILRLFEEKTIDEDEKMILKVINSVYGYKTASELTQITHRELPWKQFESVADDINNNPEISIEVMQTYYQGLLDVYEANKENDFENECIYTINNCNFAYNKKNMKNVSDFFGRLLEITRQVESKSFNIYLDENGELVVYE